MFLLGLLCNRTKQEVIQLGNRRWKNQMSPAHLARAAGISRNTIHHNIDVLIQMYKEHPEKLRRLMHQ